MISPVENRRPWRSSRGRNLIIIIIIIIIIITINAIIIIIINNYYDHYYYLNQIIIKLDKKDHLQGKFFDL